MVNGSDAPARRRLNRIGGRVIAAVAVVALAFLAHDAWSRALLTYGALHGDGPRGALVVEGCGPHACVGDFVSAERRRPGVPLEGAYRPGERVPAVFAAGRAWPLETSVWLYPAAVASLASIGLVALGWYVTVRIARQKAVGR